jgi:hypothetical protein
MPLDRGERDPFDRRVDGGRGTRGACFRALRSQPIADEARARSNADPPYRQNGASGATVGWSARPTRNNAEMPPSDRDEKMPR